MRASLSAGSTTAPHFVILSTSFVHAALLRRCCKMMRASWHSIQAVVAFACIGPGGRSAVTLADTGLWASARNGDALASARMATTIEETIGRAAIALATEAAGDFTVLCGAAKSCVSSKPCRSNDMDLHLIDGVVKIAA